MATLIKAVLLCNTRHHLKGAEVEVTAAELEKLPHIYKAKSDILHAQAEEEAREKVSSGDLHRKMKEDIRRQQDETDRATALLRQQMAEHQVKVAEEAAKAVAKAAEETERAQELERLRAENARLLAAQRERDMAEQKVIELRRPAAPVSVGLEEPPKPPEQPADAPVPPHKRQRG